MKSVKAALPRSMVEAMGHLFCCATEWKKFRGLLHCDDLHSTSENCGYYAHHTEMALDRAAACRHIWLHLMRYGHFKRYEAADHKELVEVEKASRSEAFSLALLLRD